MAVELEEDLVALFPGQGSIAAGAGAPWRDCASWQIVSEVSDATGVDVAALLLDTSDEDLVRTDRAQLATFTLSLVGWSDLLERQRAPRYVAGHSLGELSALCAANVITLADGARVVAARGAAMASASIERPGAMVALMGGDELAADAVATSADLWIANVNGTGQIVVSGTLEAVADLVEHARERGWRRATPLNVAGAFHSPLMSPAQDQLDAALDQCTFRDTVHVVGANVDGRWRSNSKPWRELVAKQLTSPVQFLTMIEALPESVVRAIEMPPSGVLAGLVKRIRNFDSISTMNAPGGN